MRINTNVAALISNNNLQKCQDRMSVSIERLSSGYKINDAKDNPAGIAISDIMRSQIRALDQAESNASDGVSVVETAEGALSEIEAMLQRMNELSVKAVNGTNTDEDREAIQLEVDALSQEIDRIASDTEFNDQSLLDGTFQRRVYFTQENTQAGATVENNMNSKIKLIKVTDVVEANDYKLNITSAAKKATATIAQTSLVAGKSYSINGYSFTIDAAATQNDISQAFQNACEKVGITATPDNVTGQYNLESVEYGKDVKINLIDNADKQNPIIDNVSGDDAQVSFVQSGTGYAGFADSATIITKGDKISVHDINGFELTIRVGDITGEINAKVKDMGKMNVQVGANEGQEIDVNIAKISCYNIGIEDINLLSASTASRAIEKVQGAIDMVTAARTELGAYQNRFEYAISNLNVSQENMTAAFSRIRDVDMAQEMTEYTQTTVLSQAATSVLAQANARPETVLQLLAY